MKSFLQVTMEHHLGWVIWIGIMECLKSGWETWRGKVLWIYRSHGWVFLVSPCTSRQRTKINLWKIPLPDSIQMTNGGTGPFQGNLIFVNSGRGPLAPSLALVNFKPPYNVTVLLNNYYGRQFNSLNDVKVHPQSGKFFFTDQMYAFSTFLYVSVLTIWCGNVATASFTSSAPNRSCEIMYIVLILIHVPFVL